MFSLLLFCEICSSAGANLLYDALSQEGFGSVDMSNLGDPEIKDQTGAKFVTPFESLLVFFCFRAFVGMVFLSLVLIWTPQKGPWF